MKVSDLERSSLTDKQKFSLLFGQVSRIMLYLEHKDPEYFSIANYLIEEHREKAREFSPEFLDMMYREVKEFIGDENE